MNTHGKDALNNSLNPELPWHVVGAGAMGCLWAARLWQRGLPVTLILRDDQSLEQYRQGGGISLEQYGMHSRLAIPAQSASTEQGRIHRLILATKAQDALAALKSLQHRLLSDTLIVLLQNGLAVQEAITEAFGDYRVFCLSTSHGAWMRDNFHVVHAGFGKAWLGTLAPVGDPGMARKVLSLLPAESMAVEFDPHIARRLWLKLAINCAINALTVVHDCRNGELLLRDEARQDLMLLTAEIEWLYEQLPQAPVITPLQPQVEQVLRDTADNLSSTLQDHRRGRPTEIAFLNGHLCELAVARALPCPENRRVLQMLQARTG